MNIEQKKLSSLLMKADERLMLSCFGIHADMSDVRGKVFRLLKEKAIDCRLDQLGIDGEKVAYGVRLVSDRDGVRCDRRTLPKELQTWIDCPYDLPFNIGVKDLPHGKYICVVSYKMVGGTYEYPDESDLYLSLHRIDKMN